MGKNYLVLAVFCILAATRTCAQSAMEFIENKGQWDQSVRFKGQLNAGSFFLQDKGFVVLQHNADELRRMMQGAHSRAMKATRTDNGKIKEIETSIPKILHSHAYSVRFEGGSDRPQVIPEKVTQGTFNYLLGSDPSKWASNVRSFQAVVFKNIYPGIDARYYSDNGKLKYDLIVNPGADPNRIIMKYEGANKLQIRNRELVVKTSVGDVRELYPYSFQFNSSKGRTEIESDFELIGDDRVKFRLKNYDRNSTLVIDPTVVFSSFTGSAANEYGFTATPGPDGSLYSGGIVFGDGFPTTIGAFQSSFQGGGGAQNGTDMAIMKFSPNGSQRVYATYLGGGSFDYPHSLFCDPLGNLVVMGRSYSNNFPGTVVGPGGAADIVVTKMNATGTGIIGSLRIGGTENDGVNIFDMQKDETPAPNSLMQNYGDDSRSEVVIDGANNIYVAAQTQSNNFPVTSGAFQKTSGGKQDGVVIKINSSCNAVIWSTYLGGAENDGAFVLDLQPGSNDVYVGGATASTNFPGNKTGTISSTYKGGICDGYLASISNDGTTLRKTTYLGTAAIDIVYGVKFDRLGFPYVMGITRGSWPVINATYSNANSKQFIGKIQPDLSAYVYSTVFGSGASKPNISPVAFLVDRCENVYISGWGGWIDDGNDPFDLAGVAGMPVTSDARKSVTDNKDFYFFVLRKNASNILYGSFFGQDGAEGEHVDGGTSRFDQEGVIYQAICANCGGGANYPTTPGVVGPVNGSREGCNLAALKIAFNFAGVAAGPKSFANGVPDSIGCAPFTVQLRDTVLNAKTYEWNFGDGSPVLVTDQFEVTHTFTNVGTYTVRLIAIDSNTCNIRDTSFIQIKAGNNIANLAFLATKLPPCESLSYKFDNTSTAPASTPFTGNNFTWDFGDGFRVTAPFGSVNHSYIAPGTYNVKLILNDTSYCNAPDSITQVLRIAPLVAARFETPPAGCAPYDAVFTNTSLAGQSFVWDFGDGTTSTEVNPIHRYPVPGRFVVRMTATDPSTCNGVDDTTFTLIVSDKPRADFSFSPIPAQENRPTIFTNLSTDAVRYKWVFGDGDSTLKTTADTTLHQYNITGTYLACLVAYNEYDCTDTICKQVQSIIVPLLDVPTAFTPGRFGRNSIIRVEGFGIARMSWKIYNRWGQVVYETGNYKSGWDGTYKGQPQPMDVYAYTLDVEFTDGTKTRKTGDITLIR